MKPCHFKFQTSFSPKHMEHLAQPVIQVINPLRDWNTLEHFRTLQLADGTFGNTWSTFRTANKVYNIENMIINEVFQVFHLFLTYYTGK